MAYPTSSSSSRGYGAKWQRLRERVLADALGLCASCARQGRTTAATCVDHVKPKAQGGTDKDPLQALCDSCHDVKTQLETGRRPKVQIGLDGWPIAEVPTYKGPLWRHGKQVAA